MKLKKKKTDYKILKRMIKENSPELVMRITSAQYFVICTKAPSLETTPFDSWHGGYLESTIFIPIPPTTVALLLQYSGSRFEHRDEFSSCK